MNNQVNINFFIAGAAKCGTTSMAHWLAQHPNIFIPEVKEPDYFYPNGKVQTETEYLELFSDVTAQHKIVGEASVRYLGSVKAIDSIENFTEGRAKYLVLVRNPIEMAESFHAQRVYTLNENILDFEEAWQAQFTRKQNLREMPTSWYTPEVNIYGDMCLLGEQVSHLMDKVGESRVKIVLLEDLKVDPRAQWISIMDFLNIPDDGRDIFPKLNTRRAHRSRGLAKSIRVIGRARRTLRIAPSLGIASWVAAHNKKSLTGSAPIDGPFREEMREFFQHDIKKLAYCIKRDLSHWR